MAVSCSHFPRFRSCVLARSLCLHSLHLLSLNKHRSAQRASCSDFPFVYVYPGEDFRVAASYSLTRVNRHGKAAFSGHRYTGRERKSMRGKLFSAPQPARCRHFPFFLHLERMGRKMWKLFLFHIFSSALKLELEIFWFPSFTQATKVS